MYQKELTEEERKLQSDVENTVMKTESTFLLAKSTNMFQKNYQFFKK